MRASNGVLTRTSMSSSRSVWMGRHCEDHGTWLIVPLLILGDPEDMGHDEAAIADPAQRVEMTPTDRDAAVHNALNVPGDVDIDSDALKDRRKLEPADSLKGDIDLRAELWSLMAPEKKLAHPDTRRTTSGNHVRRQPQPSLSLPQRTCPWPPPNSAKENG